LKTNQNLFKLTYIRAFNILSIQVHENPEAEEKENEETEEIEEACEPKIDKYTSIVNVSKSNSTESVNGQKSTSLTLAENLKT
jgi:hypothetical protein